MLKINKEEISRDMKENWAYFLILLIAIVLVKAILSEGFNLYEVFRSAVHDIPFFFLLFLVGLAMRFSWRGWVRWSTE